MVTAKLFMTLFPQFIVHRIIIIFYLLLALAARVVLCGLVGSCDPSGALYCSASGYEHRWCFGERVDTLCGIPDHFGGTDSTPFPREWRGPLLLMVWDSGLTSFFF